MDTRLVEELKRLIEDDGVSPEAYNRLLLVALISMNEQLIVIQQRLAGLETLEQERTTRLDKLEQMVTDNPSLVWLLRFRTRATLIIILAIFVVLSLWFVSDFRKWLFVLAGLPSEIIPLP